MQRRIGGYLTADGRAIVESCSVIFAFTETVEDHVEQLWALASDIATVLKQESILLNIGRIDEMMAFFGPHT